MFTRRRRLSIRAGRRWRVLASSAAVVALLLTACGSGSSNSSSGSKPTGTPIKVMTLSSLTGPKIAFPDIKSGVDAAVGALNNAGGIHGRPIQMTVCDDKNDPNLAASCARQAVSEGDVAVIGTYTIQSNVIIPILEAAGIPYVGNRNETAQDMESRISFPIYGPVGQVGESVVLAEHGCKKGGIVVVSLAAGIEHGKELAAGFEYAHIPSAPMVGVSLSTVDFAATISTLASQGVECLVASLTVPQFPTLITAVRQSGKNMSMAFGNGAFTESNYQQMGPQLEGIFLVGQGLTPQDKDEPGVKKFYADLDAYAPSHPEIEQFGLDAWGGANMLFDAIKSIKGDISRTTVLSAMGKVKTAPDDVLGLVDATKPTNFPGLQRSIANSIDVWQVKSARPVLIKKNQDLSGALPALSKVTG